MWAEKWYLNTKNNPTQVDVTALARQELALVRMRLTVCNTAVEGEVCGSTTRTANAPRARAPIMAAGA